MKKRAGLFVFFNKEGHVGRYIEYLLDEVIRNVDDLFIMVIGILDAEGEGILSNYSNNISYKENKGFTGAAWKEMLFNQIGFEKLKKYDEVLFFNDIFYGPFFSLNDVFEEMDKKKDLDFWGITRHYQTKDFTGYYKDGIIPEHIQTYFYVVRKRMLESEDFYKFWKDMENIQTAQDDVGMQETHFTDYFNRLGYKWDSFVKMDSLKGKDLNNYCMNYEIPYTLLKDYKMPFLRRKALVQIVSNSVSGPETEGKRALDYIRDNTDYDINMIWDDLLRNNNIFDLYTRLHLNYVLPTDRLLNEENNKKIAIIIDTRNCEDGFYERYTKNINKQIDVIVFDKSLEIDINKYDYVCYIRNGVMNTTNLLLNKSYKELLYDNMIFNSTYINNVIATFEKQERLGILLAPTMIGESYWGDLKNKWIDRDKYYDVKKILDSLECNSKISYEDNMVSNSKALWIKTVSIKGCKEIDNTDAIPYIAQNNGFYTGIAFTEEYMSVYINGLEEEYRRYISSHPYAAPDSIPFSVLFRAIFRKIQRKIIGK